MRHTFILALVSFVIYLNLIQNTFILGPHFLLGINTFIYSMVFYQTKLIPRKISIVGIIGALLIFIGSLLEMFGIISHISIQILIMALPIAIYEMVLALWLIFKGYNLQTPINLMR